MRKIVGRVWLENTDEMVDTVVTIERTDDDEIAISGRSGYDSGDFVLYLTASYEARELLNAILEAQKD